MKGYWTGYAYAGIMPNGRTMYFVNREEYEEAYMAYLSDDEEE